MEAIGVHTSKKAKAAIEICEQLQLESEKLKMKRNAIDKGCFQMIKKVARRSALLTAALKMKKRCLKRLSKPSKERQWKVCMTKLQDFFRRSDISRPIPCKKSVKKFKVMHVLETTMQIPKSYLLK